MKPVCNQPLPPAIHEMPLVDLGLARCRTRPPEFAAAIVAGWRSAAPAAARAHGCRGDLAPCPVAGGDPQSARVGGGLCLRALRRACSYIEEHIDQRITLEDVANAACVSRFHFARLFRVSTGLSPMEYVLHARIERAKRLLRQSNQKISATAVGLGFCDQSHFTRTFRRVTGFSPSQYARLHAETAAG